MKNLSLIAALCALALTPLARAVPIEIPDIGQDIAKNGTGVDGSNANDAASNFFRLQTVVTASLPLYPYLPTPVFEGYSSLGSYVAGPGSLTGFSYAVIHYGAGSGGTQGAGGGVEIFYLNGATSFTFPASGTGQNGFGGFSSLTLFKGTQPPSNTPSIPVPDGGSTAVLLGLGFLGLGALRRRLIGRK